MSRNVVFCWSDISGYMAACWRSLQQQPDINLKVVAFQARSETAFADELMEGIPCRLLDPEERQNSQLIKQTVLEAHPDIVVLCGWLHKPYRQLAFDPDLCHVKFMMGMDTPWQGTWKQQFAPFALRAYIQRMAKVVVSGERSWQYAQRLGVPNAAIAKGLYSIDYKAWQLIWHQRTQKDWPRSFLFVGRYIHKKAIDHLVKAYQIYRTQVADPWPLVCCGQGPLEGLLQNQSGIKNYGFVQPADMLLLWQNAGAFLLPSRFDPWPLALVEAGASGLPIVCTDACGSAVEVVRSGYNGFIIPPDNLEQLVKALVKIHQRYDVLPQWGQRSQQLAAPYDAEVWAQHWHEILIAL